jgi:hypothetical protein
MKKYGIILCLGLLVSAALQAKVLIITHNFNRPEFIEIQYKTFKHFLQDEYEFVVFNDANTPDMFKQINEMCDRYNIKSIAIPQSIHDKPYLPRLPGDDYHRPNVRHVNALQYSLDVLGFDFDGIVAIVDSDLFLVKPMSIHEYMADCDIAAGQRGVPGNVFYFWPGIVFLKMNELPNRRSMNFNCGVINGYNVDSGGWTHYYLSAHPTLRIKWINELMAGVLFCPDRFCNVHVADSRAEEIIALQNMGFDEEQIKFLQQKPDSIEFFCQNRFLHYRAGTNYDNQSDQYLAYKHNLIHTYLDAIMREK